MPFHSWPTIWQLKWYRVAKYKQRRQIMGRPALGAAHMPHIQNGACTGLSYAWIRQLRTMPTQGPVARCAALNSDASYTQHNYLASVYNSAAAGASYPARMATVAHHALGTAAGAAVNLNVQDFVNFTGLLHHLDTQHGEHLVAMDLNGVPTNHLCALSQGATHMRFFDPNLGEFRVANANRLAFFRNLVTQYATYVSGGGVAIHITFDAWDVSFLP